MSSETEHVNWENYQNQVLSHQTEILGWCSKEKAKRMMDLIYRTQPDLCVELGVYGGSSIYPTASALKFLKQGKVVAVDPWNTFHCLEGHNSDTDKYRFWSSVDQEEVYKGFHQMLEKFQLKPYCEIKRKPSLSAAEDFFDESIDILHIDGNHTESIALGDAQTYLQKVKSNGHIWCDDANYPEVSKALEFLTLYCDKVEDFSTDECILFKKR
ncbi:MAG: class I SAM-dependent methyltransferase [Chlamydiales bacterium]|nr:class I SAM-dependent methyltransferase [Chlamydiales bacterium]